jgi:hypothetical protein
MTPRRAEGPIGWKILIHRKGWRSVRRAGWAVDWQRAAKAHVDGLAARPSAAAVSFRDPGATAIGERIREFYNSAHEAMTTATSALVACRVRLWAEAIARLKGQVRGSGPLAVEHVRLQSRAGGFSVERVWRSPGSLERVWPDLRSYDVV